MLRQTVEIRKFSGNASSTNGSEWLAFRPPWPHRQCLALRPFRSRWPMMGDGETKREYPGKSVTIFYRSDLIAETVDTLARRSYSPFGTGAFFAAMCPTKLAPSGFFFEPTSTARIVLGTCGVPGNPFGEATKLVSSGTRHAALATRSGRGEVRL